MPRPQKYDNNLQRATKEVDSIVQEQHEQGNTTIKYLSLAYIASRIGKLQARAVRDTGIMYHIGRERDGAEYVKNKGLLIETEPYLKDIGVIDDDD